MNIFIRKNAKFIEILLIFIYITDMIFRKVYKKLKRRVLEPRAFLQVILGPRQVGKTTAIKQVLAEVDLPNLMVSADGIPSANSSWISEQWETARTRVALSGSREFLLVLDEIQKINNWSEIVKKEWDSDTANGINIKVVLLGSSRLLLMNGLTESLAGRFELIRMGHWNLDEMQSAFDFTLNDYIYFGGYPGAARLKNQESRWRRYILDSIVEPAISKDVLQTSNIYKPALLKQVFELGSYYSGKLLSLTKMLGQLQDAGNVTTIANYMQILSECNLLCGLQKFARDASRKYNSIPKYQVYNSALHTAYTEGTFKRTLEDPKKWGTFVESAVGANLVSNADQFRYKVYYWREHDMEVDFILVRGESVVAIEVKSGARATNSGLSRFATDFTPRRSFIVGSGGIPLEEFFKADLSQLF